MNFIGPIFSAIANGFSVLLQAVGLKNAPEMKDRDKACKDQEAADRIDKAQEDKNEKSSREDWG